MGAGARRRRRARKARLRDGTIPGGEAAAGTAAGPVPPFPPEAEAAARARRYEALGRVMAELAGQAELLQTCRDLSWWQGSDLAWYIEWREGPCAAEVAGLLAERIREAGGDGIPAGPVGPATDTRAGLEVLGVSIVLRAIDPLGRARMRERQSLWRMAAALEPVPPAAAARYRRHWEQLLGG